jgi:small-conductance mechanosensitive channel
MNTAQSIAGDVGAGLGRILGAILVLLCVLVLARYVSRWLRRRVERTLSAQSFGRNGAVLIGRLTAIFTYILAVVAALASMGVSWTGLLTLLGAGTVALGLSLQDVLKNFFSGIFLLMERPFRVGDHVKVRDVEGEVQGIDVRTTLVKIQDGSLVMIPNSVIFTEILTNRSKAGTRRLDLAITSKGSSVADVERRIHEVLADMPAVSKPIPSPTVRSAKADETVFHLSMLIEDDPQAERSVIHAIVSRTDDGTIEVSRS